MLIVLRLTSTKMKIINLYSHRMMFLRLFYNGSSCINFEWKKPKMFSRAIRCIRNGHNGITITEKCHCSPHTKRHISPSTFMYGTTSQYAILSVSVAPAWPEADQCASSGTECVSERKSTTGCDFFIAFMVSSSASYLLWLDCDWGTTSLHLLSFHFNFLFSPTILHNTPASWSCWCRCSHC